MKLYKWSFSYFYFIKKSSSWRLCCLEYIELTHSDGFGIFKNSSFKGVERLETIQNLSWSQRIQLRFGAHIFLRFEKRKGWKVPLPIFLIRCSKHGLVETHPQGFDDRIRCPKCREEFYKLAAALDKKAAFLFPPLISLQRFL